MNAAAQSTRASLWMLVAAFSFACMGAFTHGLGPRCHWVIVALVRALFMFGATATLARLAGVKLVFWRPRVLWVRSLAGSFSLVCNFYALTRLPVADALTLSHTYPLWIVVLGAILFHLRPRRSEVAGVAVGLVGVILIQRPHLKVEGDALAASVALISSVSTAVAMLGLHRLRSVDTRAVVAHFAGVASVVAGTWVILDPSTIRSSSFDPTSVAMLAGVAASGTVGQFCLTRAYTLGSPSRVAVVGLSQVIFAMAFDVLLWGRVLTPLTLLGFALVLVPTAWLGGFRARRIAATAEEPKALEAPAASR